MVNDVVEKLSKKYLEKKQLISILIENCIKEGCSTEQAEATITLFFSREK